MQTTELNLEGLMAENAAYLMERTMAALPDYGMAGIDPDVTDRLLQRDGKIPFVVEERGVA